MKEDVIEKYPFLRRGLIQYFGEGISVKSFLEENEYFLQKSAALLYSIMNGEEVSFPINGDERVKNYIITKIILKNDGMGIRYLSSCFSISTFSS